MDQAEIDRIRSRINTGTATIDFIPCWQVVAAIERQGLVKFREPIKWEEIRRIQEARLRLEERS